MGGAVAPYEYSLELIECTKCCKALALMIFIEEFPEVKVNVDRLLKRKVN